MIMDYYAFQMLQIYHFDIEYFVDKSITNVASILDVTL
jgi:hypothetical protein